MTIFAGHLTQNAVRDGARIASHTRSLDNAAAAASQTRFGRDCHNLFNEPNKDVTVSYYSGTPADCAEFVEVTAGGTYNFTLYKFMRLFGLTAPNTMPITRTTRMHYEFQPYLNGGTTGRPPFVRRAHQRQAAPTPSLAIFGGFMQSTKKRTWLSPSVCDSHDRASVSDGGSRFGHGSADLCPEPGPGGGGRGGASGSVGIAIEERCAGRRTSRRVQFEK